MKDEASTIQNMPSHQRKATMKGLDIISSINNPLQVDAARAYIRNYTRMYGPGKGAFILSSYLNRKLGKEDYISKKKTSWWTKIRKILIGT